MNCKGLSLISEHTKRLKHYRKLIGQYVNYWAPVMGLDSWAELSVDYTYVPCPDAPFALAKCQADWQHMTAVLSFYLGIFVAEDLSDERTEAVVVHEMCHALLSEISPDCNDGHEERVVTYLTESFLRTKYRERNNGKQIVARKTDE